jgi:hypothetical protein
VGSNPTLSAIHALPEDESTSVVSRGDAYR